MLALCALRETLTLELNQRIALLAPASPRPLIFFPLLFPLLLLRRFVTLLNTLSLDGAEGEEERSSRTRTKKRRQVHDSPCSRRHRPCLSGERRAERFLGHARRTEDLFLYKQTSRRKLRSDHLLLPVLLMLSRLQRQKLQHPHPPEEVLLFKSLAHVDLFLSPKRRVKKVI